MALDGLIILDPSGKPIITSHFRAHPPNYPLLHIDAYNAALSRRKPPYAGTAGVRGAGVGCAEVVKDEMEPVIWVSVPVGRTAQVRRGKQKQKLGGAGYGSDSEDDNSEDESQEEDDGGDEDEEQIPGTWTTAGLCHVEREGMSFLAPLSHEGQSPSPLSFQAFPFLDIGSWLRVCNHSESPLRIRIPRMFPRCLDGVFWTSDGDVYQG
jgi:hypothetical protein